jgi:hypothetical protein
MARAGFDVVISMTWSKVRPRFKNLDMITGKDWVTEELFADRSVLMIEGRNPRARAWRATTKLKWFIPWLESR